MRSWFGRPIRSCHPVSEQIKSLLSPAGYLALVVCVVGCGDSTYCDLPVPPYGFYVGVRDSITNVPLARGTIGTADAAGVHDTLITGGDDSTTLFSAHNIQASTGSCCADPATETGLPMTSKWSGDGAAAVMSRSARGCSPSRLERTADGCGGRDTSLWLSTSRGPSPVTMRADVTWRTLSGAIIAVTTAACIHTPHAAAPAPFCFAPPPGAEAAPVTWHRFGRVPTISTALHPDTVARILTGTWEVLTVTTEGVEPPGVERWQLKLVSTDPQVRFQCTLGPCRSHRIPAVAGGAPLRKAAAFDSAAFAQRRSTDSERVEAHYDSTGNHLTLSFGPPIMDAGAFYTVTDASDTTLKGRWTRRRYMVLEVRRGNETILEHRRDIPVRTESVE